jgi:hypothetical protein
MRDTFPMSRRAIECGKTLDETLDETLEETLADTLPGTPARLGASPYDWTTGFEPAATVEHGPLVHTASYMLSLVPGPITQAGPSPRAHYPPPRRRPTTRPTRCHPAQATDGRRPCRGQLKKSGVGGTGIMTGETGALQHNNNNNRRLSICTDD